MRITLDGRSWTLVNSGDISSWGAFFSAVTAYLPNMSREVPLLYDEGASKKLNTKELGEIYAHQYSEGIQEKLAQFDKHKTVTRAEPELKEADDDTTKACERRSRPRSTGAT